MSHGGGGGKEGGVFHVEDHTKSVWGFLANLITAFVNVILGTDTSHH